MELSSSDDKNMFVQSPKEGTAKLLNSPQFALKLGSGGQGME